MRARHILTLSSVASIVRRVPATALHLTGLVDRRIRTTLRERVVVLMYHRVLTPEEIARTGSHPGIITSLSSFEAQMVAVKGRFYVMGMRELIDLVATGGQLPGPTCVITFDDGWLDNYTNAFPVLRRLALPACVFLPVNFIGARRLFWRETLAHQVIHAIGRVREDAGLLGQVRSHFESLGLGPLVDVTAADSRLAVARFINSVSAEEADSAWRLIGALREATGDGGDNHGPDQFLSWNQVREMASAGIAFGAHGANHVLLNGVAPAEAERDIRTSRETLHQELADAVEAFSYPNGSLNPTVARLVREAGFSLAFTTQPGAVRMTDDPMALGRYNVHEGNAAHLPTFLARMAGLQ